MRAHAALQGSLRAPLPCTNIDLLDYVIRQNSLNAFMHIQALVEKLQGDNYPAAVQKLLEELPDVEDPSGALASIVAHLAADPIPSLMAINAIQSQVVDTPKVLLREVGALRERVSPLQFVQSLAALASLMPDLVAGMLLHDQETANVVTNQVTKAANEGMRQGTLGPLARVLLSLFSALAVNKDALQFVGKSYPGFIMGPTPLHALVTIKYWNTLPLADHPDINLRALADTLAAEPALDESIEGLSLLAPNPQIRDMLRIRDPLREALTNALDGPNAYGALVILENLSRPARFAQRASPLNAGLAGLDIHTGKPAAQNTSDDAAVAVFHAKLVPILPRVLSMFCQHTSTPTRLSQCVKLLANVVFSPTQSLLDVSLCKSIVETLAGYLLSCSANVRYNHATFASMAQAPDDAAIESRLYAIRAIAALLVSPDVDRVLPTEAAAMSVVPFLLEFPARHAGAPYTTPFDTTQAVTPADVYESLAALANVASLAHQQPAQLIFTLGFGPIMVILQTERDKQIQGVALATLESLVAVPLCCARLFNWQTPADPNFQNFNTLFTLLGPQEPSSAGVFASAAHLPPVRQTLQGFPPFLARLHDIQKHNKDAVAPPAISFLLSSLSQQ